MNPVSEDPGTVQCRGSRHHRGRVSVDIIGGTERRILAKDEAAVAAEAEETSPFDLLARRAPPAGAEIPRSLPRPQRRVEKRHEGRERAKGAQERWVEAWAAGKVGRKLAPGEKLLVPQVFSSRMIRAITARHAGQAGAVESPGRPAEGRCGDDAVEGAVMGGDVCPDGL